METVLEVIRDSISFHRIPAESLTRITPPSQAIQEEMLFLEGDDPDWDYHQGQAFDDGGEGAGIEGDLEAEDD